MSVVRGLKGKPGEGGMLKRFLLATSLSLVIVTNLVSSAGAQGTVSQGWMGGAQSPAFPQPLVLSPTRTFAQDQTQPQAQPQSLPGGSPSGNQPNPTTGQGTAQPAQPGA